MMSPPSKPARSTFEQRHQLIRNEARSRRIDMTVAASLLPVNGDVLRHDEMQIVLCARHKKARPGPPVDLDALVNAQVGTSFAPPRKDSIF